MALTTTEHAGLSVAGAVVGATVLVAAAPVLLPVAIFGGIAAAVTASVGAVIGGVGTYVATKPDEVKVAQLMATELNHNPRMQSLVKMQK